MAATLELVQKWRSLHQWHYKAFNPSPTMREEMHRQLVAVLDSLAKDMARRGMDSAPFDRDAARLRESPLTAAIVYADVEAAIAALEVQALECGSVQLELPPNQQPDPLLIGWPEILNTLGQKSNHQGYVGRLNKQTNGPIQIQRGAKPKVRRSKLIEWWDQQSIRFDSKANENAGKVQTVEQSTYSHGRDGKVVAGIGGHEKRRRSKKL